MSGQDPRPPKVLALDLEGTLISNAFSVIARPGLHEFLAVCNELFPRIVMITAVSEPRFRRIARLLVEEGLAPTWFEDVEYVRWHGSTKDLSFISGAAHADVVLIDDFREYVHPGQEASWVEIACFDPPYPSDDCELQRLAQALRARMGRFSRTNSQF